jgi:hypothetical protein
MGTIARLLTVSMLFPAALGVQAQTTLMEAARRDAAQFARELPQEKTPGGAPVLRSERQARIDRAFENAYAAAHTTLAEDVTKPWDGTDAVFRIKTPFGTNLCMNWREKNRFVPTKGKTTFVGACNR